MNLLITLLQVTIPAIIVGGLAYFMIRVLLKNNRDHMALLLEQLRMDQQRQQNEKKSQAQKLLLPVRLQAYERLVLFLERIQPSGLVTRLIGQGDSVSQFQMLLIRTIREEFEHNLSQQLYVSESAWQMVKAAREEVVQLINRSAGNLSAEAGAADLAREVIVGRIVLIEEAIARLKEEVGEYF
jgi:hypothetical protein